MTSSPCVKICVVDPVGGLCIGCGRTVEEISLWSEMTEPERLRMFSQFVTEYIPRRVYAAHIKKTAPSNGSGHKGPRVA